MPRRTPIYVHFALLIMAALWGGSFIAIKYLLTELTPLGLIAIRFWITGVIFIVFLAFTRKPDARMPVGDLLRLIAASVTGIVGYQLALNFGEKQVAAGTSSLIVAVHPVITMIAATYLLSEKFTSRKIVGLTIAICGLLMVVLLGSGKAQLSGEFKGILTVLLAPIAWSASTLLTKPLSARYPPAWITSWIMIIAAIVFTPLGGFGSLREIGAISSTGWVYLVFLSIGATFLAYMLWYYGLERLEAGKISIYIYLSPFFAVLGGALLLHEVLPPFLLLGGALILGGVALTNRH